MFQMKSSHASDFWFTNGLGVGGQEGLVPPQGIVRKDAATPVGQCWICCILLVKLTVTDSSIKLTT